MFACLFMCMLVCMCARERLCVCVCVCVSCKKYTRTCTYTTAEHFNQFLGTASDDFALKQSKIDSRHTLF